MCTPVSPASPQTPDALIERCLAGDQLAWETIVRQHWRKVFNVAYKFVGKHDEAEDLTQDIFLKIFKSLDTFDRRANFQTWLISVSRNLCIDHYRSVRKERQTIDRDVDADDLSPASPGAGPAGGARAAGPGGRCCARRSGMLPASLRTAVLLRDIQELSYQEIADRLQPAGGHGQVANQPRPQGTRPPGRRSCAARRSGAGRAGRAASRPAPRRQAGLTGSTQHEPHNRLARTTSPSSASPRPG